MLARQLGLRKEEAFKFNPDRAVLKDGRVLVSEGTKGGRDRIIQQITSEGRAAIEYARSVAHGLRQPWAQERYQAITGFDPPAKFESREDYRAEAARIGGRRGASWTATPA